MDFSQGRCHVFDENENKALREVVYLSEIKTLKKGWEIQKTVSYI